MIDNRVRIKCAQGVYGFRYRFLIRQAVKTVLKCENVPVPCTVDVTITDNRRIHELNKKFMDRDRPTDVLSFPMQNLTAGNFSVDESELDPETSRLYLGDMVISLEKAKEQGREFGHGVQREVGYLTVHSMLHLLGYDHMDEGKEKCLMRKREEEILAEMGLTRD